MPQARGIAKYFSYFATSERPEPALTEGHFSLETGQYQSIPLLTEYLVRRAGQRYAGAAAKISQGSGQGSGQAAQPRARPYGAPAFSPRCERRI